jgi:hypothetical protein
MSIDLHIELTRPISLRPLLPKIASVLAQMLGTASEPTLTLEVLQRGERLPAVADQLPGSESPLFLVSIAGEPETVGLLAPTPSVCVTMAAQRTNLEYALGAAIAITLARELCVRIEDARRFFGPDVEASPDSLLDGLKVPGPQSSYREAAEHLTGRIDQEW